MSIKEFIKKRPYLIWYVKDYDSLSTEAIVEATLNYGSWDDVQKMLKIVGLKEAAEIFRKQTGGLRTNYDKETKNYFSLYFNKYVKTT